MEYGYMPPLRPLFTPSWLFPKTPISEFFSSSRPYICLKSQIFGKFAFKSIKSGKSSVLKPKIWSNFSSMSLKLDKNEFFKTSNLAAVFSTSHYFLLFGSHTHTKMKVEYPWPPPPPPEINKQETKCLPLQWFSSRSLIKVSGCNSSATGRFYRWLHRIFWRWWPWCRWPVKLLVCQVSLRYFYLVGREERNAINNYNCLY